MKVKRQELLFFFSAQANKAVDLNKNYYKTLKIEQKADQKAIKNSYFKLAKTLHPDVNPHGKEKFIQIQEAYEVLSSKELKQQYDQSLRKQKHQKIRKDKQSKHNSYNFHQKESKSKYYDYAYEQQTKSYKNSSNPSSFSQESDNFERNTYQKARREDRNFEQDYHSQDEYMDDQWTKRKQKKERNSQRNWKDTYSEFWQQFSHTQSQKQDPENFSPKQGKMRDRVRGVRGLTSAYNVLWTKYNMKKQTDLNKLNGNFYKQNSFDERDRSSQKQRQSKSENILFQKNYQSPSMSKRILRFLMEMKETIESQVQFNNRKSQNKDKQN